MAHFAHLRDGLVDQIIVVANSVLTDEHGNEVEALGKQFCADLYGQTPDEWVQTSYSGSFRGRYAAVGGRYDTERDLFIYPQPYASWTEDEATGEWLPPVPRPDYACEWDEVAQEWRAL